MIEKPIIFVDMDGVLVDFVGGVRELFEMPGDWSPKDYDFIDELNIKKGDFWDIIADAGASFWRELELLKGPAYGISDLFHDGYDIYIASSPTLSPNCLKGKREWLDSHASFIKRKFFFTPFKWMLSAPGRILIDDDPNNCEKWREHGGTAFLLKQSYNDGMPIDEIMKSIYAFEMPDTTREKAIGTAALERFGKDVNNACCCDVPDCENPYMKPAIEIAELVLEKNKAYGDSFSKSGDVLKILFPGGIKPEQYCDALLVTRIVDKLFRLAKDKDAFGENPCRDIVGYGLLGIAAKTAYEEQKRPCACKRPDGLKESFEIL